MMEDCSFPFDISRCRKKGMIGYLGHKEIDAGKVLVVPHYPLHPFPIRKEKHFFLGGGEGRTFSCY